MTDSHYGSQHSEDIVIPTECDLPEKMAKRICMTRRLNINGCRKVILFGYVVEEYFGIPSDRVRYVFNKHSIILVFVN